MSLIVLVWRNNTPNNIQLSLYQVLLLLFHISVPTLHPMPTNDFRGYII